jgi:hypothetical protein
MKKLTLAIMALVGFGFNGAFAQDTNTDNHTVTITIPEVALLDIELAASKNFAMAFAAPTEAGLGITAPAANATLWLNYSSIVTAAAPDNIRTVSVKSSTPIPGVGIVVTAGTPVMATGAGTGGAPVVAGPLTTTDQTIIGGIGSCYTGDGAGAGSNVSYAISAAPATYASLVAGSTIVTVTYTLSDNP